MFKGSMIALITPFDNGAVDEDGFANAVVVGKLFQRHVALSVEYARGPLFTIVPGLVETDNIEQWSLRLHIPFAYRD